MSGYKCIVCDTEWGIYHVCSQGDFDAGKVVLMQGSTKVENISELTTIDHYLVDACRP